MSEQSQFGSGAGRVSLVGAGPGDPELMTVKAVRALESADAVVYDNLVDSSALSFAPMSAELHFAGKCKGAHFMRQEAINELLWKLSQRHGHTVRLKGGDPLIFGRGGEEYSYLTQRGISCTIIPGITAAAGAAASLGISLTHRQHASGLTFLTGHRRKDGSYDQFRGLDLATHTYVVYMGLSVLEDIMGHVCAEVRNRNEPVLVIENATRPGSRVVRGTAATIPALVREAGLTSPALTILGRVAGELGDAPRREIVQHYNYYKSIEAP